MKKILFPTDFSETANRAFVYALHLAERMSASIVTYHIFLPPPATYISYMPYDMRAFFEQVELESFENYKDAIPPLRAMAEKEGLGHIEVNHVLVEGDNPIRGIEKAMREEAPDFVVMGTTGARGLKEVFLGSVAGEVLESASCPVLVVPREAPAGAQFPHMAFTTDFKDEEMPALDYLIGLARQLDSKLHVINVDVTHTDFYVHRMEKLKAKYKDEAGIRFEELKGDHIFETVSEYLEEHGVHLLAMLSYKRNFFRELFHYSLAKKMAYHGHIPMLALPASMFGN